MMETDFLIVGAGIVGLSIARELGIRYPGAGVAIVDKEAGAAMHASGRNSGVLHAGFYYTAGSMKARLTAAGNRELTAYCLENGLSINRCGKVVVAAHESELPGIFELKKRGENNGVDLQLLDEKELRDIEPNARTCERALFSPATSTIDPRQVCAHIVEAFPRSVRLFYNSPLLGVAEDEAFTPKTTIRFKHLFNAAGLYADKIAQLFGAGRDFTMMPFKGLYLRYNDDKLLRRHIYPVPNLKNPFLGVHFTITVDGHIKIGPTAIPALWRENYDFHHRFQPGEFFEIVSQQATLFGSNSFGFRSLALEEVKKYRRALFIRESQKLVKYLDPKNFGSYTAPGIRAQLLNVRTRELVMDFLVENGPRSTHVLNAVSPAFTSSFPFARLVVDRAAENAGFTRFFE